MDSFRLGNLLCLILLHCIYQSGAFESEIENVQRGRGAVMGLADQKMRSIVPLRMLAKLKAKLGAASDYSREREAVFDVQRSTMTHVLHPVEAILYDQINVNYGGAYNNKTGKFTAPCCGFYFFSYSSLPGRGLQTDVALMKNGTVASLIHSVLPKDSSQLATKCTILQLHKGDQVWVKLVSGNLWSRDGSLSFQGFLVA